MSETQLRRIGFIGLGRMGYPMTKNLLAAGYEVHVYDIMPEKIAALVPFGAIPASSPAATGRGQDLVITMVLDDAAVAAAALGPEGALAGMAPGSVFADMSTVSPLASVGLAPAAEAAGVAYLRAKVSGSIKPATEGTLTVFASGPRDAYDRCLDAFRALGKTFYYVGDGEQAIYIKLVHSIMVGITAAMVGEAFTFGERGGADWRQLIDVINHSALASVLLNYKAPLLEERDYSHPQSTVDVAAKDIDLALSAAKALNIPLPVTALVREFFRTMQARGEGGLDFIGIVQQFEAMAGMELNSAADEAAGAGAGAA